MLPDLQLMRFTRALLAGAIAERHGKDFVTDNGRRAPIRDVEILRRVGAIDGNGKQCRANSSTRTWIKRAQLERDSLAAQHRIEKTTPSGVVLNLSESPLARLALGETAFLKPHQVEAGERIRRLVERAQLRSRVTMSYSDVRIVGGENGNGGDISDMAVDARRTLAKIHEVLPRECAGVVLDVCGWLKGLQEVERERGWPRRSAKLVLRIGLDQIARHFGLGPFALGREPGTTTAWMSGARPQEFP